MQKSPLLSKLSMFVLNLSLCIFISYYLGPPVNKAVLLELQKTKAKEMEYSNTAHYDNASFENNEIPISVLPGAPFTE